MLQSNTITLTGDAAQAAALIEWALARGVEITVVAVGQCTVQLAPRRLPSAERSQLTPTPQSIHEQFGGQVFRDAVDMADDDDQEFQPVVGRT